MTTEEIEKQRKEEEADKKYEEDLIKNEAFKASEGHAEPHKHP